MPHNKDSSPSDAAALAASALAGALAVFIEPGPFDAMSIVTGVTLLSIVISFQGNKPRRKIESFAFATVIAFLLLLPICTCIEYYLANCGSISCCSIPIDYKINNNQSRVSENCMALMWCVSTVILFLIDLVIQCKQ